MDSYEQFQSVDSADGGKSSGSDSKRKTVLVPDESRYLTTLLVPENREPRDDDSSLPGIAGFKLRDEQFVPHHQETKDKISAVLRLLTFREGQVLIQFWSPRVPGRNSLLTTLDQPFGLGVADEALCLYRRDSERNLFVVDKDHEEEDISPPARVFRQGLAEWTPDVINYLPRDFPQQECAIHCNLHGYLALPVFDLTTSLCIGVLELLMASKYPDYAYEVEQVHKALKTENLASPQVHGCPTSNVPDERRQHELVKIFNILKLLCDDHRLPLAQTWSLSTSGSFVSHDKLLQKCCSSFNTRCIGKACMSTAHLPFHVRDLGVWHFREACKERHLEKSRGVIGRALLTQGSCFCGDITKLSEEEYPLVHQACMYKLTSCFAIFLPGVERDDGYVLELFLPLDINDATYLVNLVQTLKQRIEATLGFEPGDLSSVEFVGPPMEKTSHTSTYAREKISSCKQSRKRKIDPLTVEAVEQHLGTPMHEAVKRLAGITETGFFMPRLTRWGNRSRLSAVVTKVTETVTVKVTFKNDMIKFTSPLSSRLFELKNEVALRFKLINRSFSLKYTDEGNYMIIIACDAVLHNLLRSLATTLSGNGTIKLSVVLTED